MNLDIVPLRPLEPGQLQVMRASAAILAAGLIAAGLAGEIVGAANDLPFGIFAGPAVLLGLWLVLVSAPRRFRHWGFAFTGDELHVAHGWLTQVHTIVPVGRVQHIDLTRGPLERRYGVATLVLHTAGTEHSQVLLPGLAHAEAESIRDVIRGRIGTSPW